MDRIVANVCQTIIITELIALKLKLKIVQLHNQKADVYSVKKNI